MTKTIRPTRRQMLLASAAGAVLPVHAQDTAAGWPRQPVKLIVPQGTAGGLDTLARLIASGLSAELKQPVVVENKPGASGNIGAEYVARARPDGYTVLIAVNQLVTVMPHLTQRPGFDALTDLVPVTQATQGGGYILAVTNSLPVKSVEELVAYARQNPGKLAFGSYGVGSAHQLCAELLMHRAGIQMIHVPYKQTPSVDLVGGQIQVLFDSFVGLKEQVRANAVRGLAVTRPKRAPELPQLPTLADTYPGFEVVSWHGLWMPKATPQPIVEALNAAVARTVNGADMRRQIQNLSYEPIGSSQADTRALIAREAREWKDTIRQAGIKLDA